MSLITERLGLLSGQEAAGHLGIAPSTVRSWRARGYLTPAAQTRDGSKTTSWYRTADVWRCASARLSRRQVAAIRDAWAEVDDLVANAQANCHSDL